MTRSLPEVRSLAQALLNRQGMGADRAALEQAAELVLQRIAERISPLVGTGGFVLFLQRALRRTLKEHPWMGAVQIEPGTPWRLNGLSEAADNQTREEALLGAQALLAELIGLIARFLGADMAIRMVRQSFPELTRRGDTGAGSEESIHE
jgi:hypothetical protein